MVKRGPKPEGKIKIKWSANFAYAIGLIVTDGCLYNDKRHMSLTTKDIEQAENFKKCLGLDVKIGFKAGSASKEKKYCHVQFGDVNFYNFLLSIGLSSAKSKTIGVVKVPDKYFLDYVRGCFDGDGCFYSYYDPRWRSSHMFYTSFSSASKKHIDWLQQEIYKRLDILGHISKSKREDSIYNLRYAKEQSLAIIKKMYYNPKVICLSRKRIKIEKALLVEKKQQKMYT
jgi:intein-encoded DNA endonuclease-like protein